MKNQEFKPFDRVLGRDCNGDRWTADIYSSRSDIGNHICVGYSWQQCIPYEGNEALLGTTSSPKEEEQPMFKAGDVLVSVDGGKRLIFKKYGEDNHVFSSFCTEEQTAFNNDRWLSERFRLATSAEKVKFIEVMHGRGEDFDFEKLEVVPWRWKPKEKEPTFKAGDVLSTFGIPKCIFIYEGMNGSYTKFYALLENGSISYHGGAQISGIRHATEEEKAQLIEAMHSSGKNFDFNKLEVKPWKWMPREGDEYYAINSFGEIEELTSLGERSDVALCRCGNCFGSKAEAKASALYRAYDRDGE